MSMYSKLTLQRRKICCQLLAKAVEIILDIKYQKLGTADIQLDNVFFKLDTDRDVCYKRDHNVVNKNGPSFCLQTVSPYIYTSKVIILYLTLFIVKITSYGWSQHADSFNYFYDGRPFEFLIFNTMTFWMLQSKANTKRGLPRQRW